LCVFDFLKKKKDISLGKKKKRINKRRNKERKMKILRIIPILTFVAEKHIT